MSQLSLANFSYLCSQLPLPLCASLDLPDPVCYSRNLELGQWLLLEPGVFAIYLVAILLALLMIYHVKCKYTAVGRKEMIYFFYLYLLDVILGLLLVGNIIPVTMLGFYNTVAAMQLGCVAGTFWVLLMNGFVGFRWAEDGTLRSLWIFRLSTLAVWSIFFIISLCTFNEWGGLGHSNSSMLWFLFVCFILGCMLIYFITQIVLISSLDEYWALGPFLLGMGCFSLAAVFFSVAGVPICKVTGHYLDGMFLGEICMLLSVMMIYKYWDTITGEDLEYALPFLEESSELGEMGKRMNVSAHKKNE